MVPMKTQGRSSVLRGASRPGLARARRSAFLRGGVLSRGAEMALVARFARMSEGDVREERGAESYYGSTMFSVDLASLESECWRGELDREALRRAVEGSVRMRIRFMRLSVADARQRLPDRRWGTFTSETRVDIVGDQLHVDVDVEAALQHHDELDAAGGLAHGSDPEGM